MIKAKWKKIILQSCPPCLLPNRELSSDQQGVDYSGAILKMVEDVPRRCCHVQNFKWLLICESHLNFACTLETPHQITCFKKFHQHQWFLTSFWGILHHLFSKSTNRISNIWSFWTKITSNYNDDRFLLGKNNISTINIIISYTTSFIGRNKWISKYCIN
jgi:hypothetical protein